MGSKQRREREKEELRQEIIDAARDLFIKEGYENVSMRRIAEKIEYSPTTIYLYFQDKADLLFSICNQTFTIMAESSEAILKEDIDPIDKLRKIGRCYIEFGLKNPNQYRVTFMAPHGDLKNEKHEGKMGKRAFDLLKQAIEECIAAGKFREVDPEAASQVTWAMIHGLTSLLITFGNFHWVPREQLLDLSCDVMTRGFGSQ